MGLGVPDLMHTTSDSHPPFIVSAMGGLTLGPSLLASRELLRQETTGVPH